MTKTKNQFWHHGSFKENHGGFGGIQLSYAYLGCRLEFQYTNVLNGSCIRSFDYFNLWVFHENKNKRRPVSCEYVGYLEQSAIALLESLAPRWSWRLELVCLGNRFHINNQDDNTLANFKKFNED